MWVLRVLIIALSLAFTAPLQVVYGGESRAVTALSNVERKALADALFERKFDVASKLIEGRSLEGLVFQDGRTPLGMLVSTPILEPNAPKPSFPESDMVSLTHKMLQAGADPGVDDSNGMSPLILLVTFGEDTPVRAKILGILVDNGANVNVRFGAGQTPLILAALFGKPLFAEALVKKGADASIENGQGKTAAEVARENGHADLAQRLSSQ